MKVYKTLRAAEKAALKKLSELPAGDKSSVAILTVSGGYSIEVIAPLPHE